MTSRKRRLGAALALLLPVGCDPNPEGPHAPPSTAPKPADPAKPARQPVTKNPREIVHPD